MIDYLAAEWPAPAAVRALSTTRRGGVSEGPWHSLNLAAHVGDAAAAVAANRRLLVEQLGVPSEPLWLDQAHGIRVRLPGSADAVADASIARGPGDVCVVLSADCLPVLLCDRRGELVAAAHAGWRGLLAGVLEHTVLAMQVPPPQLMAWLGPAIGPSAFEVGEEVRAAFLTDDPEAGRYFAAGRSGHWFADLYGLARLRLKRIGVGSVSGGGLCTYRDPARFFSYRRDGISGRMASLIWLKP